MAKNTIVDTVADAVVRAELAIVRTGRQAVQAVNRKIGAGKRKVAGKKKVGEEGRPRRPCRKAARTPGGRSPRPSVADRKAAKKASKSARRR